MTRLSTLLPRLALLATCGTAAAHAQAPHAAQAAQAANSASAVARVAAVLAGDWRLNLARTHYGPGVDRRRRERFVCAPSRDRLACTIDGERANGGHVVGTFTLAPGRETAPVAGVPGVDAVRMDTVGDGIVDATFSARGAAVFGYRAYRSNDGRSLVVVTVDPVSRAPLTTVVVYDRR